MTPLPLNCIDNQAFSKQMLGVQLAWDSTSLGIFKTCPRKYYYLMVEGWAMRSTNYHLVFGQVYHGALERFDHAKFSGATHDEACVKAIEYALEATWDKDLKRPWFSDDSKKNRYTLIRSIVWYLDIFKSDPIETITLAGGKPAVELSFRFEMPDFGVAPTGEGYLLCGHIDRLGEFDNKIWVTDRKTTGHDLSSDYFDQFTPDNQMSLYAIAGMVAYNQKVSGLIIDAVQVMVGFSRYLRGFITRSEDQLDEWLNDARLYVQMAAHYAKTGYWPMNDKACFRCEFRGICSKPPSTRRMWLEQTFVRRLWDPLRVRGDI